MEGLRNRIIIQIPLVLVLVLVVVLVRRILALVLVVTHASRAKKTLGTHPQTEPSCYTTNQPIVCAGQRWWPIQEFRAQQGRLYKSRRELCGKSRREWRAQEVDLGI